jgi:cobalt/nickel transport system permease protein
MMGVLGAFIFAAQMINFTIPGTGSSGHMGGGMILTILLGPYAAFLVIASVLVVQCLFFADGGLMALGCNIFNMGFFPAFIAYPLLYRSFVKINVSGGWACLAAVVAAVAGLQLGAFSVVLETVASGISELPFKTFVLMMLPIHLAIGLVEGLVTAAVVAFAARARPETLAAAGQQTLRPALAGLLLAAVLTGGIASWFASTHPDGLEWSIAKVTGREEVEGQAGPLHEKLAAVQEQTAVLPDYGFKAPDVESAGESTGESWPAVNAGTSLSGLLGGLMTLMLAGLIGFALKVRARGA